jgi:hypothetical protein
MANFDLQFDVDDEQQQQGYELAFSNNVRPNLVARGVCIHCSGSGAADATSVKLAPM